MKRFISLMLGVMMLMSYFTALSVSAFDGTITISADKTAQWTAQEKATGYDLRIHGYKDWETAAYMGFSLPDNFTSDNLVSATLRLYTKSASTAGKGYLYSADYAAFTTGTQYEGADDKPAYNETQIKWIDELPAAGAGDVDITDYIKTIADNTENVAFRIDGKSYSTTSSRWIIGSLTNDTQEPQLVLEYDDPNITKTEVSVNIKNGSDVLKTYSDRVVEGGIYTISNDQTRYIRKGNDVYYFPMNGQTVYSVSGESAAVDVEFDKITVSDLVFFEDFNVSAISDISSRGISATNAEISKGTLSISDSGTVTLPSVPAHTGALTLAFDFTASSSGSTFTFKSNTSDIISLDYSADTQRHTASVMLDGATASISIDGVSANNSTGSTADAVTQIAVSGGAVIDNLRISAADLTYTGTIKNSSFAGGTDKWTVTGNAYASDDISNSSFIALKDTSSISQKLTGIESGKYDLHARVKNDNMGNIAYVYAKAMGHPIMKTSVSVTTYLNDGDWRDIYVKGITIDEAECEIGLVLSQLTEEEIMVDNRVTDEPMPDGKGTVFVKSFELTSSTEKTRDTFLAGGDINWLTFLEDKGIKYYDENGVEKDAVQVMAENGANIVRLRLYNDPGKGHGDSADYLPDGWQGPEDILRLARRAKEKGMQIQLTFHYSDYWTNANDQLIPHEWAEKVAELGDDASQDAKDTVVEQCLYDFTKDFMQKMHDQGTDPEYVSFGNEMHTGLLFDKNRATYDYGSTYRWLRLASLLKTAGRAAKEVYPDTKVILHLDGAGNWGKYNTFFSACKENEVPYDVIGISYYPYWYPEYDVSSLVSFCNKLIDTFDKDIMFMETGYSFADKTTIGGQDTRFTDVGPYQNTFGQSNMGQKAFMEELYSGFKQIKDGRCIGDLYWDPIMIQHEGVGWAYKEATNVVEHNKNISITVFDTQGRKLPAQSTFKDNGYIPDTVTISGRVTGITDGDVIKLTVDGKDYNVTPDRFGDYVLRIPYEDEVNVTAEGDSTNRYDIDMTMLSVAWGVNFTDPTVVQPAPVKPADPSDSKDNLLTNGGFEADVYGQKSSDTWKFPDKEVWYNENANRTRSEKVNGNFSAMLYGTQSSAIAQKVSLEAGKTYLLTAKIKADKEGEITYGFFDGAQNYPASNPVFQAIANPTEEWQDISLLFDCTAAKNYVVAFKAAQSGNMVYVDNVILQEATDYIEGFDAYVDDSADEDGVLAYSLDYVTEVENPTLYVALYDNNGVLQGVKKDLKTGNFKVSETGNYSVKAFLWNGMEPICDAQTKKVEYENFDNAYMFVHFVGEQKTADDEQIYFSVSKDGKDWDILNDGNKILTSAVGERGVRDPYIVRSPQGDKFYLMATDLSIYNRVQQGVNESTAFYQCTRNGENPGSNKMVVWESSDLVNWSEPRIVQATVDGANSFWAPECIWDESKNAYMVFGASRLEDDGLLELYRSYTTDFQTFTEKEQYMVDTEDNNGVFDTTIIKDGDTYYRIYKTNKIKIDKANSLSGDWTSVNTNIHSIANNHEGPTICKVNGGDSWMLMLDSLTGNGGYQPFMTSDLDGGQFTSAASTVSFPNGVKYRHGAIMPITHDEYKSLVKKYGIKR